MRRIFIIGVLLMLITCHSYSSNKKNIERAKQLAQNAVELMNVSKFNEAIVLLDSAILLDKAPMSYPYEKAVSYFKLGEWEKSAIIFDSLKNHPQVNDQVYQMLGNALQATKKVDEAINVFNDGLTKFPNSGRLYLGLGTAYFAKDDPDKMRYYFLKGIQNEPNFAMNYFYLGEYYYNNKNKAWAVIYYESFFNLSNNTRKLWNTSKTVFQIYQDVFFDVPTDNIGERHGFDFLGKIEQDSIDTKERNDLVIAIQTTIDKIKNLQLPQNSTDLKIIDVTNFRTDFIKLWYEAKLNEKYSVKLFEYHKKLIDAGYFTDYNYWLMKESRKTEFDEWTNNNKQEFKKFLEWQTKNRFEL